MEMDREVKTVVNRSGRDLECGRRRVQRRLMGEGTNWGYCNI